MNQDFSKRVSYCLDNLEWEASPAAGVWRKKLAREAAEHGQATSLVRYEPGAAFATHTHDGGEEILVLEGIFSDESGDYPQGSYFRNPPGTSHAPSSATGCVLLVKLCHFQPGDNHQIVTTIADTQWRPTNNHKATLLHHFEQESTIASWLSANEKLHTSADVGRELFVVSGSLLVERTHFPAYSWLRIPPDDNVDIVAGGEGALVLFKQGHFSVKEKS